MFSTGSPTISLYPGIFGVSLVLVQKWEFLTPWRFFFVPRSAPFVAIFTHFPALVGVYPTCFRVRGTGLARTCFRPVPQRFYPTLEFWGFSGLGTKMIFDPLAFFFPFRTVYGHFNPFSRPCGCLPYLFYGQGYLRACPNAFSTGSPTI